MKRGPLRIRIQVLDDDGVYYERDSQPFEYISAAIRTANWLLARVGERARLEELISRRRLLDKRKQVV